jgi:hypothetical protein
MSLQSGVKTLRLPVVSQFRVAGSKRKIIHRRDAENSPRNAKQTSAAHSAPSLRLGGEILRATLYCDTTRLPLVLKTNRSFERFPNALAAGNDRRSVLSPIQAK